MCEFATLSTIGIGGLITLSYFTLLTPPVYRTGEDALARDRSLVHRVAKVVEPPPNLKFMVSTSLILTQCKITAENTARQCCAPDKNIFPYHLSVLAQVLGL